MLRYLVLTFLALLPAVYLDAAEMAALRRAAATIMAGDLQAHVDVLADDSFEGREAGSRGGRAASMYLLKELESRGLRGAGDDASFFQAFGDGYRNVMGLLEGSDPELKKEVIVLGAHYDHVGYGSRRNSYGPFGYVHNGADDNASGTAGLLETAEAFLQMPSQPRRSVMFAFWDGEEKGLLGSKHFVANPTVPLKNIVFMINLDMIGRLRNQQLQVYGSRTTPGLRRFVSEINYESDLRLNFNWELKANSDHHSFIAKGVPALMFHTGLHDDYHRPSDDSHKVNSQGMEQASRFLFGVAYQLADREVLGPFRAQGQNETPSHQRQLEAALPPARPRLGVRWYAESDGEGLVLAHVERGGAADRGGLLVGDRLLEFSGQKILDKVAFRRQVLHARSPVDVLVERPGAEEPLQLSIDLDGTPSRVGIAWREDQAEPGTVILTRVVNGSPASIAGLKNGDRVYEVGSESFADGTEFFEALTTLPSPLEMTVEREGRLRAITLDLPPLEAS
ncbi:MAG: hypothetical protein CMJ64_05090 [Planctomycetaceae bacterium]|nr:hypothetical protein [Planctomycetaceae bacterium]